MGPEGFTTTKETQDIRNYFAIAAPNIFANNDSSSNVSFTKTSNPYVDSGYDNVLDPRRRANVSGAVNRLTVGNSICTGDGTNQFNHLSNLAATQTDPTTQSCGWVYNTANPDTGGGAYGTNSGPFNTDKTGTWMWNLNEAKERYHTDICRRLTSCGDVGSFNGLCGWCKTENRGVPINANGTLAYPTGTFTSCGENPVINTGSCPSVSASAVASAVAAAGPPGSAAAGPPGSAVAAAEPPGSAAALASPTTCPTDGSRLSRDCLLQKVLTAGCDVGGTLYSAILQSSPADYTSNLSNNRAFSTYQARQSLAPVPHNASPLDRNNLSNGNLTVANALNGFTKVKSIADTASGINLGLKAAAEDLCYRAGSIDNYDFCAELVPTSRGPFDLNCVQKAFLRAGGQYAGSDFPVATMATKWWTAGSISNWGDIITYINTLYTNTRSTTRTIQVDAMRRFYGINLLSSPGSSLPVSLTVCIDGLLYKKLGSYKFVHVGWPWPSEPPNGQIFIAGAGFPENGKWDHLSGRNQTYSQIGLSVRDINGVDIRPIMNPVGSANNIQLYPGDPTTSATINYYIKSQASESFILLVGNGIPSTWAGGPGGYVNIMGRNGNRGNFKEQFSSKYGIGPLTNEIYDIYYAISNGPPNSRCDISESIKLSSRDRTPLTTVGNGEDLGSASRIFFQDNNVSPSEYALGPRAVAGGFPRAPEGIGYKFYDAPTGGNLLGIVIGYALRQDSGRHHRYISIIINFDREVLSKLSPLQTVYYQPP